MPNPHFSLISDAEVQALQNFNESCNGTSSDVQSNGDRDSIAPSFSAPPPSPVTPTGKSINGVAGEDANSSGSYPVPQNQGKMGSFTNHYQSEIVNENVTSAPESYSSAVTELLGADLLDYVNSGLQPVTDAVSNFDLGADTYASAGASGQYLSRMPTPFHTPTSAILNAPNEFKEQRVILADAETSENHEGTYAELYVRCPTLRRAVMKRLSEWKEKSKKHAHQNENECAVAQEQTQSLNMPATNPSTLQSSSILQIPLKPIAKETGVRYDGACPECQGTVVLTGNNDGVHCTRCFNKKNKEIRSQNAYYLSHGDQETFDIRQCEPAPILEQNSTPGAAQFHPLAPRGLGISINSQPTTSNVDMLTQGSDYQDHADRNVMSRFDNSTFLEHASVDEAQEYILHRPAQDCQPLNLDDDDWHFVKTTMLNALCVELFDALDAPPSEPQFNFSATELKTFRANHQKVFQAVKKEMKTPAQKTMVKARVMVALGEIIRTHEVGIPKTVFDKRDPRTHRGYEPDLQLTCEARARKVIELARTNKYVAIDIVRGRNIDYLAQAPSRYVERKMANFKTNRIRGNNLKLIKEAEQKKRGKKDKTQSNDAQPWEGSSVISAAADFDFDFDFSSAPVSNMNHLYSSQPQYLAYDATASGTGYDIQPQYDFTMNDTSIYAGAVDNGKRGYDDAFGEMTNNAADDFAL